VRGPSVRERKGKGVRCWAGKKWAGPRGRKREGERGVGLRGVGLEPFLFFFLFCFLFQKKPFPNKILNANKFKPEANNTK